MTFSCEKGGRYVVTWVATINNYVSQLNFVKYCTDPTCEGTCGTRGVCNMTSNACGWFFFFFSLFTCLRSLLSHGHHVAHCVECEYGYRSRDTCNIGLIVDSTEVCAGETFTISWEVTLTDAGAREDFIQITPPDAKHNATNYNWTMSDMNDYMLHAEAPTHLPPSSPAGAKVRTWQWFFLSPNIRSYTAPASIREYLTSGSYQFSFTGGEAPGAYGVTFMRSKDDGSGNSTVHAVATVRLLPSTHERCQALNNAAIQAAAGVSGIPSCVHGSLVNSTGVYSCTCEQVGYHHLGLLASMLMVIMIVNNRAILVHYVNMVVHNAPI
jgi:hypothetical protein